MSNYDVLIIGGGPGGYIAAIRAASGWQGLYFGGVCFKKQRPVDPALNEHSARIARPFMDVVTTSGIATGEATDLTKIADFRRGLGTAPLAIASATRRSIASIPGRVNQIATAAIAATAQIAAAIRKAMALVLRNSGK